MAFDRERHLEEEGHPSHWLRKARAQMDERRSLLLGARHARTAVEVPERVEQACVAAATQFRAEGHRADYILALAARGHAAIHGRAQTTLQDLRAVAPMVLQHRRPEVLVRGREIWTAEDDRELGLLLQRWETTTPTTA
jgi:Mg-chelatase subunit ChlI